MVSSNIPHKVWQQFIDAHPRGTAFQSPEMYALFEATDKFRPLVLGAFDHNDHLCGLLMGVFIYEKNGWAKLLSSRFVVYGGPLLSGDENQQQKTLELLLQALVKQTKHKALFIQFRSFYDLKPLIPVFNKYNFNYLDRLNYIIDTRNRETAIAKISESRRRQIRKGMEKGAKIIEPVSIDQVRAFYDILYRLYRYKIRKPLPDWSFFENFHALAKGQQNTGTTRLPWQAPEHPGPEPNNHIGIIRLIVYDNTVIGGILAPVFKKKCIYEWYVCGLDREYKDQYPSVLATWAGLEYAIENNIQAFDFMGVGKPGREYGVRDFKARFGGELVNYGRITRINNRFLYSIAELGYNVLALFKKI